jgi:hypothetical protein
MKKFKLLFILVLSVFFAFSCSHNDDEEELADTDSSAVQDADNSTDTVPDETTNDDDKTDTASENNDADTSDTGITDNDITENADDPDTTPDSGDPQPDGENTDPTEDSDEAADDSYSDSDTSDNDTTDSDDDSDTDSGDSQPDDDGDTSAPEQPSFPECSPASAKPCIDSATGLIWSSATSQNKKWAEAGSHCNGLTEGGFEDWRMPTISELRTLVRNCQKTAAGGACNVTDECTASYSTANPKCYDINLCTSTTNALGIERCGDKTDGSYSLLGDASVYLWSSSVPDEDHDKAWYIYFKNTNILNQKKTLTGMVRCVRKIK